MQARSVGTSSYYILRVAAAMCFIGHGAFGIITKKIWLNYLAVFGIGPELGYHMMPIVGSIDILFGISLLVYPTRAVFAWLVGWGMMTALLRPLSGEPFAEAIERGGNYGAPLAMLLLVGTSTRVSDWFRRIEPSTQVTDQVLRRVELCLRAMVFLLLTGHGVLNLIGKQGILDQYAALGMAHPLQFAQAFGVFEVLAAVSILVRPVRSVLLVMFAVKVTSELFYPSYGVFEWIERGGSYGSILALWFVTARPALRRVTSYQSAGMVA